MKSPITQGEIELSLEQRVQTHSNLAGLSLIMFLLLLWQQHWIFTSHYCKILEATLQALILYILMLASEGIWESHGVSEARVREKVRIFLLPTTS